MKLTRRHTLAAPLLLALGLAAAPALAADALRVGAYPANPPWEFKNEKSEFEGFEVDLIREVGKRMGREVEISDMGFQALFAATASNRIDAAISSVTITDERLQSQSFTQGYFDADLGLVTAAEGGVASLDEMKGKVVGTLAASTGEAWIRAHQDEYGWAEVKTYPDQNSLLLDVANGRVPGAINDKLAFEVQARQMQGLKVLDTIPTGDRYAIMMAKDSPLLAEVNDAISAIKEDGTMATIYEKWLESAPAEGSSTLTAMPVPTSAK